MIRKLVAGIVAGVYVSLLATLPADAQAAPACPPWSPNQVVQSFPSSGPTVTTWNVCWHEVAGNDSIANPNGLVIGPVDFKTSPSAPWRRVIYDMRISDFFVPYHQGFPRFYDLSGFNFKLTTVTTADCPASAGGTLLSSTVCKEVHDRGLLWKDYSGVKRGQELVVWGCLYAGNYRYVERFVFRDDGTIIGMEGATGQNYPPYPHEPHTHDALWRIDLDVGTPVNDTALLQHMEDQTNPAGTASDTMKAITAAQGLPWNAQTHDMISVTDPFTTNKQGHNASYHLLPLVDGGGMTRHFEDFSHFDFWLTPYNPAQMAARYVASKYVPNAPPVGPHRDVVVWVKGSLHHHPRDEDGIVIGGSWKGTALVMYTGFMLMPNDVFDCSPFYGPCS
jgi:Cu2+-containing amine oxidase